MVENEESIINPEEEISDVESAADDLPLEEEDDEFEESFEDEGEDEVIDDDYDDAEEELFRENPLKALWIRMGEIKELLEND